MSAKLLKESTIARMVAAIGENATFDAGGTSAAPDVETALRDTISRLGSLAPGWEPIATNCQNPAVQAMTSPNAIAGSAGSGGVTEVATCRNLHQARTNGRTIRKVRLVFAGCVGSSGGNGESAMPYPVAIKCSVETVTGQVVTTTATIYPAYFGEDREWGKLRSRQILITEPIDISTGIADGDYFCTRVAQRIAGSGYQFLSGGWLFGGTPDGTSGKSTGLNNGEGMIAGDMAWGGTITAFAGANKFSPVAILGYVGSDLIGSITGFGDSIPKGTECAVLSTGIAGWLGRVMQGVTTLKRTTYTQTGFRACVYVPQASESLKNLLRDNAPQGIREQLGSLDKVWVITYGTNDLGGDARNWVDIKVDYRELVRRGLAYGTRKFVFATILPRKYTASDIALTGITPAVWSGAKETQRLAMNADIRSGAFANYCGLVAGQWGYIETCAAVESDASGVLTLDGGFWKPSAGVVTVYGTVNSASNLSINSFQAAVYSDSGRTAPVTIVENAYQAMMAVFDNITTGADGVRFNCTSPAGYFTTIGTLGQIPSNGDLFRIIPDLAALTDATHPTQYGHALIAASVNTAVFNLPS